MAEPHATTTWTTDLLHLTFLPLVHLLESRCKSQVQAQLGVEKNDLCGQLGGPERGEGGKGANLQPVTGEAFSRASSISETNYIRSLCHISCAMCTFEYLNNLKTAQVCRQDECNLVVHWK